MDLKRFLKKKLFPEILSYYRIKIMVSLYDITPNIVAQQ